MKIVILAAGMGSRLAKSPQPKPLTKLSNGMSILQYQITALAKYFPNVDVHLVVGYHKEMIMDEFPDSIFIYNPLFETENTSKSLLRAIRHSHDDLLWLNGDVVFNPSILEKFTKTTQNSMLVNRGVVGEEEVKYLCDDAGAIIEVSKTVQKGAGEALGINYFTAESLPVLRSQLENCGNKDYFEKAIEGAIQKGVKVWPLSVGNDQCCEIDFPADLEKANGLLDKWKFTLKS